MRNKILITIKLIVSSGLLYFLLHKIGLQPVLTQLGNAQLSWLLLAIVVFTFSNFLGSLQWYLLLRRTGVYLGFFRVVRYYYIGLFFNNIFISNMGGDFFRLFYISRQANNSSAAFSTVFLDRFLGFTMLTFLAIMGGIFWSGTVGLAKIWPVLLILMSTWVFVIIVLFNKKLGYFFRFLLKWFVSEKILIKLRDIYNLIYDFSRDKRLLLYLFSISFVIQLSRVFIHYFAGRAIGVESGFVPFLIFIPIIALFASLPISVGGLGVREQTGVILFRRVGIPMALAIPMEFLAYLLTVVCSLPGILFFILIDKRRDKNEKS